MSRSTAAGMVLALVGALALAGCTPAAPTPVPTQVVESPSPEPTATEPAGPAIVEGGTAAQNQPYFDMINQAFLASHGKGNGQLIIDNLIAAGFRKQDMEVTPDRTAIDLEADSIIFSIRLKGECLIGDLQVSTYKSLVAPLLGTGGCLIGTTRPIDW